MLWVVAERVVSGRLQGEGLVETVSGEVPVVGGREVEPVGGHALLRRQVPAAVRPGAGRRVFELRAHGDGLAAEEAALGQGAHVLLREVALREAASRQQLLALCRGGGEAIRVGGSVQPVGEREERGGRREEGGHEKRV